MVEIENLKCKRKILILSCYRPPNDASPTNASDENDVEDFYEVLESLTRRIPKHNMLIVGGDFNAHLGQQDGFKNSYHQQTNRNGSKMKDYLQANDLISLNTTLSKRVGQLWTHEGPNGNGARLDYLLINRKWRNSTKNCRAFNSFVSVSSDHRIVAAQICLTLRANKKKSNSITCYDWSVLKNDANVAASFVTTVNNRFAILQDSIQTISANNTYKSFETACREAADAIIPQKTKVKTRKPWENEEFHQKRQLLHQAQQMKESLPSPENIRLFNEARLSLKEAYRDEQKIYLESKISQIRNSVTNKRSAEAWKTVKEITGRKSSNSSKLKAPSQEERIQLWKNHFKDLLGKPPQVSNELINPIVQEELHIKKGDFSMDELMKALKSTQNHKACGLDEIPAEEHVANEFSKNIKNQLYNLQYGSQSGRSCVAQLLLVYQEIGKHLDAGLDIDLMLLDFAKAFDSLLDTKFDQKFAAFKRDLDEKEAATQSQLKKLKTETKASSSFNFKGNKVQYEFNSSLLDVIDGVVITSHEETFPQLIQSSKE
ncbi:uncharacterized protein [Montipora foliosa]|uniref:uncharacterized protein n=1 Tax=Montipora foliosa TaxID=591990 RepID=UPI0035F1D132